MKHIRKLLVLGAVAAVACDPYTAENKATPEILSVIAAGGNSDDGVLATFEGTGGAGAPWSLVTTSTCSPEVKDDPATTTKDESAPQAVTTDAGMIFVKFNKLLDGASIQATPTSCEPAGNWLTVTRSDGQPAGTWNTCYNPSSPTTSEAASIIIYRGDDVTGGPSGTGTLDASIADASTTAAIEYTLSGNVKDKQGNAIPISIKYTVEPDAGPLGDVTVDAAAGTITWGAAACDGDAAATAGYRIYKQDETDKTPVELADVPAGTLTYTDAAPVAGRVYFISPLITNPAGGVFVTKLQGPFDESTNPAP